MREKKILLKEMSVRVLYYLGIFGVSVCRFLNREGLSLVIVYVRPKSLFFMSGKFVVEKKIPWGLFVVISEKKFLPPDILGVCVLPSQSFT